jgi:hypothetical protein
MLMRSIAIDLRCMRSRTSSATIIPLLFQRRTRSRVPPSTVTATAGAGTIIAKVVHAKPSESFPPRADDQSTPAQPVAGVSSSGEVEEGMESARVADAVPDSASASRYHYYFEGRRPSLCFPSVGYWTAHVSTGASGT